MYRSGIQRRRSWIRRVIVACSVLVLLLVVATVGVWRFYTENLKPVKTQASAQTIMITSGATPSVIADTLHNKGLIRNAWTFEAYVRHEGVGADLQAGTYSLSAAQSVQDIVAQLTHGKVTTELVTILPGQRIDQIRESLIRSGFTAADVDSALQPSRYKNSPALVDKPAGSSLEGYLYPDSFQRTTGMSASVIIQESINEMQQHLTPTLRTAFASHGLSTYQGIILASMVEKEVSKTSDRNQVAQVFLSRLAKQDYFGSDVTAFYGSELAGKGQNVSYDSPYNTLKHVGFPPTPISNVSESSLQAVAHPANTDWYFFVAGDDGTTHFEHTDVEHSADAAQYCHKLCQ